MVEIYDEILRKSLKVNPTADIFPTAGINPIAGIFSAGKFLVEIGSHFA